MVSCRTHFLHTILLLSNKMISIHKLDKNKYIHMESHRRPIIFHCILRMLGFMFVAYIGGAVVMALAGGDITNPSGEHHKDQACHMGLNKNHS